MSEEHLTDPAAAPPLPPGLINPNHNDDDNRRPPILPTIPRLPGSPGGQPQPTASSPTQPHGLQPLSSNNSPTTAPAAGAQQPQSTPAPAPAAAPAAQPDAAAGADADDHDHDHGGPSSATPDEDAAKPAQPAAMDPGKAVNMATGMISPAVQAAMGIPAALMGLGSGLLAPFAQILQQFGQGNPAMPSSSGLPPGVLDRLGSADASIGMTGDPADAYQSDVDAQANQARALDHLEKNLRDALEHSSANSTMGRDKIEQIINQVKSALQALGPIANTPAGQMGVLTTIAQGLQQAGAVLTDAVGKDSLNANTVKSMSLDYIKDLNAGSNEGDRDQMLAAGGPRAWAIKALAANGITDPRAVANWLPGLLTMGKRESGNNVFAQNNSDSNAAKGTPSKGWMQTIQSTFDAHWRPGTSRNIFDPVANAAAAIHYVMTRYHVSPEGSDLMAKVQQANPYAPPKGY